MQRNLAVPHLPALPCPATAAQLPPMIRNWRSRCFPVQLFTPSVFFVAGAAPSPRRAVAANREGRPWAASPEAKPEPLAAFLEPGVRSTSLIVGADENFSPRKFVDVHAAGKRFGCPSLNLQIEHQS